MKMTQTKLNEIVRLHKLWLIDNKAGKKADLNSSDLRSANLSSSDLSSADLSSANLRSSDLSSANLRSSDLSSADLRYADLSSSDLSSANLRSSDLSSDARIISVSGIGSSRRMTTFRADTDEVWCGCFKGTLAEFAAKIEDTHKNNERHLTDYRAVMAMFRAYAAQAGKDVNK